MSAGLPDLAGLQAALRHDELLNCMRCGFCLATCPTYQSTGHEANSPRGRIALVRAVTAGQLDLPEILPALDACLGCRACEPACPAGVRYGAILEAARAVAEASRPRSRRERWLRRVGLGWVLGTPAGIRLAGWGLWLWQASGLGALARRLGLVRALAGVAAADLEAALPRAPSPRARRRGGGPGRIFPARGERRARVAFFTGCLMEIAFWAENRDGVALLQAAGCEVVLAPGQGCCGAVHAHAGAAADARAQARRNLAAFAAVPADYVVNAAGGCGAALKEYGHWFRDDPRWAAPARQFSARVRDLSELLLELGPPALGARPGRYTYQDSCHLRNVQQVAAAPRQLLSRIPGAEYVELPGADGCCGAAGTYNLTHPEQAAGLGNAKAGRVAETGAGTLVVANPPCHLHLRASLRRRGLAGVQVRHIATVLREAAAAVGAGAVGAGASGAGAAGAGAGGAGAGAAGAGAAEREAAPARQ